MRLLEVTETCIFKHAIVLKSISSSPHWNIGRSSVRPVGYYTFLRPTLNRMQWVKSLSQGLPVCSFIMGRKDWNFFFLVRKCWFKKTNSFGRNSLLVRDLLGNASELQESHRSCTETQKERREHGQAPAAAAASAGHSTQRSQHLLERAFFTSFWPANSGANQNYVVSRQSVTNLACILFPHRRRKYWRLRKVPWHGNTIFHSAQIKAF